MKKLKKWLFKKIFNQEVKIMEEMLSNQKNQIENLKKRCQELKKANDFLLNQNVLYSEKLNHNQMR